MADVRTLKLWQGRIATELEVAGSGPPLLYLHGPWGLAPDRGFIARLTEGRTVYAPKFPGTSRGDHEAVHALDGWLDLAVYHGELLDALKLSAPAVVGHSFGGLLAAEIAAAMPERVDSQAQAIWSQACTGKFVWPIADRGLSKRIHRIAAPTLIVWGEADRIVAPAYAQEFAGKIAGARVAMIPSAGHLPQLEQPDAVVKALSAFLGG